MRLTKTPAQRNDYNIKLTKDEMEELYNFGPAWTKLCDLIQKEAEKLGNAPRESGQEESGDRG